jgi:hypothetical protein
LADHLKLPLQQVMKFQPAEVVGWIAYLTIKAEREQAELDKIKRR